jgi:Carboxypeptidase regulatory-like domain
VNVTDAKGRALAGAKVTLDAERTDAARPGTTDAAGAVTLVPVSNECGNHMLQIEADYQATTMVNIPADNKDPITVQLEPGTIYGGVIQNEQGKPIEGATVRIFAPPPDGQAATNRVIRRAVVRTDKQGRWQSPILPDDEGKDPMFKLAHPDYICDKEYNDTPLPPIDELKSGIGVMVLKKP